MKKQFKDNGDIVITGAAGFIATNVIRYLNSIGVTELILVDDLGNSQKWKNLLGTQYKEFVSKHEIFDWLQGRQKTIQAFIHLGACSSTTVIDGDYFYRNNYRFSIRLLEYALTHNHRFIYASSAATYGSGEMGFSDSEETIESLIPLNIYGYSKQMFDLWCKKQGVLDQVVSLKYFNIFGPYENHKGSMASMVFHITNQIRERGFVSLFESTDSQIGHGEQSRDFLYVKDAAKITCSFLQTKTNGIFNVGSGCTTTWNRLVALVADILKKDPSIRYIPMPTSIQTHYQNMTQADITKLYKHLQSVDISLHTLQSAISDYVTNYLTVQSYADIVR
ncbi:MAG: ADP-glyceromanno-heptose 6-epimerase [Chlamydiales bacterium]